MRLSHSLRLFFFTASVLVLRVRGEDMANILSSARAVRELSAEEASRPRVAEFSGVVLGLAEPEGMGLVMRDETDSIYLLGAPSAVSSLVPGDFIHVRGRTDAGGFAPFLRADEIRKIGTHAVPEPERISSDELFAKGLDARWIVVTGLVRDVRSLRPDEIPRGYVTPDMVAEQARQDRRMMTLAVGDRLVSVQLYGPLETERYVDAEVEVRGLCFNQHNAERQFLNPLILVPKGVTVRVLQPPPTAGPFDGAPIASTALHQFNREGLSMHRVRIDGVVLHQELGVGIWIRDNGHGLFVQSEQRLALEPGARVQVAGFPEHGPFSPILAQSIYRKEDNGPAPQPSPLTKPAEAVGHNGDLVVIDGTVMDRKETADGALLRLDWGGSEVVAVCKRSRGSFELDRYESGSVVSIAGIWVISASRGAPLSGVLLPDKYNLLVRTPTDITLLRPAPWWTGRRVAMLLALVAGMLAVVLIAVFIASRRKIAKERALRRLKVSEYGARLAERSRMARDLHDSVAQGLGAISLHLELAGNARAESLSQLDHHLAVAHQLVRTSMTEVRSFIHNLRTQTQQDVELSATLEELLYRAVEDSAIKADFSVEGVVHRLPATTEAQIVRITQEAVVNAVRHSGATTVSVRVEQMGDALVISIIDDGRGFDPAVDWSQRGHWGLLGMRERAAAIGATLQIEMAEKTGVHVRLTVTQASAPSAEN